MINFKTSYVHMAAAAKKWGKDLLRNKGLLFLNIQRGIVKQ